VEYYWQKEKRRRNREGQVSSIERVEYRESRRSDKTDPGSKCDGPFDHEEYSMRRDRRDFPLNPAASPINFSHVENSCGLNIYLKPDVYLF
jgi:hypothetical protein